MQLPLKENNGRWPFIILNWRARQFKFNKLEAFILSTKRRVAERWAYLSKDSPELWSTTFGKEGVINTSRRYLSRWSGVSCTHYSPNSNLHNQSSRCHVTDSETEKKTVYQSFYTEKTFQESSLKKYGSDTHTA